MKFAELSRLQGKIKRKKRVYRFTLDAISLALNQRHTRAEPARSLAINGTMPGCRVKEHQPDEIQAFQGNGKLTLEQEEVRKLKTQLKRLEIEKGILKKIGDFLCQRNEGEHSLLPNIRRPGRLT